MNTVIMFNNCLKNDNRIITGVSKCIWGCVGTMPLDCANELGYSQDCQCVRCRAILFSAVILSLFPYLICPITFAYFFKQCLKSLDLLEVWSHEDRWLLDQQVLVGHSVRIPLELTPALIMCCDCVTTCDYYMYSFVIPEYKLTYYIFWMALQSSLDIVFHWKLMQF